MAKTPKTKQTAPTIPSTSLKAWNLWLTGLYSAQAVFVWLLFSAHLFPVYTNYVTPDQVSSELTGTSVLGLASRQLFELNIVHVIVALFLVGALAHLLMGTAGRLRYEAGLKKAINGIRWLQYGISSSLILVTVAILAGVAELSVLVMIFVLNLAVHLVGWLLESRRKSTTKNGWLMVVAGSVGIVPWLAVGFSMWATTVFGSGSVPGFVYWLYATMLAISLGCAVLTYLQLKGAGRWSDYIFAERTYMVIGVVASTLLALQVFMGVS
jgi:hypothetical protein